MQYVNGPLLVLAGAGSGKTSVITHKISWLIKEYGTPPDRIVAVTFTNKAAREMKTRVADMLDGQNTVGLTVSTFHALGLSILRAHLKEANYRPGFSIYNGDDGVSLSSNLMRARFPGKDNLAGAVHWQISQWKNAAVMPESARAKDSGDEAAEMAAQIYGEYEEHLLAYNAMDFDDLILKPLLLLRQQPDILAKWRQRIQYLLVDEYQDTNVCQYELVKLLVGNGATLTVVGDDDQSIYSWRGARPENLKYLQRDFPSLKVIKLEQNYRSTRRILKAANALIAHNPHVFDKALWSERPYGDEVRVLKTRSEDHEAERVVSELLYHKFKHGAEFRDYAILFRSNYQARLFERVLRERRIPYFLSGTTSFFDRTEIKDIMAYLRLLCNPEDNTAFLRVVNTPRREIGPATLDQLSRYADELGVSLLKTSLDPGLEKRLAPRQIASLRAFTQWLVDSIERARKEEPAKAACEMLAELHYEDWLKDTCNDQKIAQRRMDNVLELVSWLDRLAKQNDGEKTLSDLVANLTLIGLLERDGEDNPGDYVSLMTLHAAKGLEFPHVFIIGMEEGILPHHTSLGEQPSSADAGDDAPQAGENKESKGKPTSGPAPDRIEPSPEGGAEARIHEERRLVYVGITRAQKSVTFSYAMRRRRGGEVIATAPSRFLSELPADDIRWIEPEGEQEPQAMFDRGNTYLANLREILRNN